MTIGQKLDNWILRARWWTRMWLLSKVYPDGMCKACGLCARHPFHGRTPEMNRLPDPPDDRCMDPDCLVHDGP